MHGDRATKKPKPQKAKAVAYRFISPESDTGHRIYGMLRELVAAYHCEISDARIALAWNTAWQPDVDGRVTLGKCKKVADLEREVAEFAAYDFVIILRQEFWMDPRVSDHQRRALLDHELMHAAVTVDEHGEPAIDECGRIVYRLRKHDLEEFAAIVDRYGCWKGDLEHFAAALDRARSMPLDWVGYTSLQQKLAAAGATVPLEIVMEWTEAERREAEVWATVRRDLAKTIAAGSSIEVPCPEHVSAALLATDAPTEVVHG